MSAFRRRYRLVLGLLILVSDCWECISNSNIIKDRKVGNFPKRRKGEEPRCAYRNSLILSLDSEALGRWEDKKDIVLSWDASDRMSDADVGMTEYAKRKHSGTGGIMKTTWSGGPDLSHGCARASTDNKRDRLPRARDTEARWTSGDSHQSN